LVVIGEASLWISYLVKREIVISRDPFPMVGLTDEFAFALISGAMNCTWHIWILIKIKL
jgi:hypothetical protein